MDILQISATVLDVLLVVAAVVAYLARPQIGGALSIGLRILLIGVMILGFAHLLESALFIIFHFDLEVNEVIHRLFVGTGFAFIIWGFLKMRQALKW